MGTSACSGSSPQPGAAPTTTKPPYSTEEMCRAGRDLTSQQEAIDLSKPEAMATIKSSFADLAARAPKAVADDMRAYATYVSSLSSPEQLGVENLPADLAVTTERIDEWWKANCGGPFGS